MSTTLRRISVPRTLIGRLVLTFSVISMLAVVLFAVFLASAREAIIDDIGNVPWAERVADSVRWYEQSATPPRLPIGGLQSIRRVDGPPAGLRMTSTARAWARGVEQSLRVRDVVVEEIPCADRVCLRVHVPSATGDWLELRWLGRIPRMLDPWPALLQVLVLTLVLGVGGALLLRQVSRRLADVASAAAALGEDFRAPPLDETGPEELRRVASAFNAMRSRLIRHLEQQSRVVAALSHDLRTPVSRMRLACEMKDELDRGIAEDLDEIEALVQSSLEALRGGPRLATREPVCLNALVMRLAQEYSAAGQAACARVAAEGIRVDGDAFALKRLLRNLLENALKFGQVARVSVERRDSMAEIRIVDEGPGIPEGELEAVFAPFYRLETSRSRDTGGMGLGLSIAVDIVQAHGGSICLTNLQPRGLCATVRLPLAV